MDKNLEVIHKRNILLLKIFIVYLLLDISINLSIDHGALLVVVPITLFIILFMATLIYLKIGVKQTMYISVLVAYLPIVFLIEYEPIIVNYIFLWPAFIVSSLYHRVWPILFSSVIVNFLTVYYFFKYPNEIFTALEWYGVYYIIIFNLFLTIFLIYSGRFTENELWSTKEFLASYFKNTSDAIVICKHTGQIVEANKSFEELTGYKESEVISNNIKIIEDPYFAQYEQMIQEMKLTKENKTMETVIKCKDESRRNLILTLTPIKDRFGKITNFICIGKDITKLKQTEEALRRTEMLSVVGQLAAGVAHEIKNPVTVLSGFVQLMKKSDQDETRQYYYEIMQSELNRILLITKEFLVLGKQHDEQFVEKKLQLLLKEVILLLKAEAEKNNVTIIMDVQAHNPTISCNPNQIKQVFINILKNSIEAMPNGGKLKIDVGYNPLKYNTIITIMDEGCGMSKETIAKIGTPFYTTKQEGTGLGMMISMKIVESHNGTLHIESEENKGTKIIIQLPLNN